MRNPHTPNESAVFHFDFKQLVILIMRTSVSHNQDDYKRIDFMLQDFIRRNKTTAL